MWRTKILKISWWAKKKDLCGQRVAGFLGGFWKPFLKKSNFLVLKKHTGSFGMFLQLLSKSLNSAKNFLVFIAKKTCFLAKKMFNPFFNWHGNHCPPGYRCFPCLLHAPPLPCPPRAAHALIGVTHNAHSACVPVWPLRPAPRAPRPHHPCLGPTPIRVSEAKATIRNRDGGLLPCRGLCCIQQYLWGIAYGHLRQLGGRYGHGILALRSHDVVDPARV